MSDLTVTPEYLEQLAKKQDEAAVLAGEAAAAGADIKKALWVTHGVISGASNTAITAAAEARREAGEKMKKKSQDLAADIRAAAKAYAGTDEQAADNLDIQVLDR